MYCTILEVVRSGLHYTFRDIVMWTVMRKCKILGVRGGLLAFLLLRTKCSGTVYLYRNSYCTSDEMVVRSSELNFTTEADFVLHYGY